MKKVLILLLITGVAQNLFSEQQSTQHKFLSRLPEHSEMSRKCEQALFVNDDVKYACDTIDKMFSVLSHNRRVASSGKGVRAQLPSREEYERALEILDLKNAKEEIDYLKNILAEVARK
jgi:hypothetical protein